MSDEQNETKPQPMSELDKARLLYYKKGVDYFFQNEKQFPLSEIDKERLRFYKKGANFFANMNIIFFICLLLLAVAAFFGGAIYFGFRRW